jgi:hypothetical protein
MASKNEVKGIRNRGTQQKVVAKPEIETKVIAEDLTHLTLEQLKDRYLTIHGQSQMMKGLILLEARDRIPSDKEFGQWAATIGLSDSSSFQTRNVYMNLARFFKDRDMTGILLTSAYEISKPSNSGIAEEIYSEVLGKNVSVEDTRLLIKQKKAITLAADEVSCAENTKVPRIKVASEAEEKILSLINTLRLPSPESEIKLLQSCIKIIKSKPASIQTTDDVDTVLIESL